jgi:hypothetical protein
MAMKPITLRNVPPPVERAIKNRAKRERVSLNRAVVGLLEEATGNARRKPATEPKTLHYDLDKFSGSWTKEEADAFDAALAEQRRVDPKDWE